MSKQETLWQLIAAGADDAPAITAPSEKPLGFRALREHVQATVAAYNAMGIGRNDRVAIVLRTVPRWRPRSSPSRPAPVPRR